MQLVTDNKKIYEDLAERRSVTFEAINQALTLVKKFIATKQRILYGGMAIDLNLKKAGHEGIYPKSAIPDYDFYSPDFFQDSLDLADILHKAGLPNVSAINAMHPSGRRVRVNFVAVADISFVPRRIYENIPIVITDDGLQVVHPDYQRLDMHRAFCYPYENEPRETITHRFSKDQKRFKLLNDKFPMSLKVIKDGGKEKANNDHQPIQIMLTWDILRDTTITGVLQYALLRKYLDIILRSDSYKEHLDEFRTTVDVPLLVRPDGLVLEWPSISQAGRPKVSLLCADPETYLNRTNPVNLHPLRYYQKFMDDIRPEAIRYYYYELNDDEAVKNKWREAELGNGDRGDYKQLCMDVLQDMSTWMDHEPKLAPKIYDMITKNEFDGQKLIDIWDKTTSDRAKISRSANLIEKLKQMIDKDPKLLKQAELIKMPKTVPEIEVLNLELGLVPVLSLTEIMNNLKRVAKPPADWSKINWGAGKILVAQAQYLLLNLLVSSFERSKYSLWYRSLYISTLHLIHIGEKLELDHNPFVLQANVMGTYNLNWAQISMARDRWMNVQDRKMDDLGLQLRPQFGYYPERGNAHPVFDHTKSPIFDFSGARTTKFKPTEILLPEMVVVKDLNIES